MKRLLSLAMAFVMVYTLGLCAFASAVSIGSAAVSAGNEGVKASYNGATNLPSLANVDVQAAYSGGLILNPYQGDVYHQSSSVASTLGSWGSNTQNEKTKPVISVPIWIRNGAECAIVVGIKDAQIIPVNKTITVATAPITKATKDKQVFLYLDAKLAGLTTTSNPPTVPAFSEYSKSNKNQVVFTAKKNTNTVEILRIPAPEANQSNWGAMKICGGVNSQFTDLTMEWRPEDTISLNYTLKIFPSL